jgi:hypothetical protein
MRGQPNESHDCKGALAVGIVEVGGAERKPFVVDDGKKREMDIGADRLARPTARVRPRRLRRRNDSRNDDRLNFKFLERGMPQERLGDSGEAERSFRSESERHYGMNLNTIGA